MSDRAALFSALVITLALAGGLVYFVRVVWPLLPPALALIGFILLAVAIIGYPIYALGQWSNRYLARIKKPNEKPPEKQKSPEEEEAQ